MIAQMSVQITLALCTIYNILSHRKAPYFLLAKRKAKRHVISIVSRLKILEKK